MYFHLKSFNKRSNCKKNSKHNLVDTFERNRGYLLAIIHRLFKKYQSTSFYYLKNTTTT